MIRFAALPVGAQIATFRPHCSKMLMMVLMIVVFPVPGPPVITEMPLVRELLTPSSCCWDRTMPVCRSVMRMELSTSAERDLGAALEMAARFLHTRCSAR